MSEPEEQPGWAVTGPDGEVVATGPQTVAEAASAAGEES
jgi:hypothetical protein